MKSKHFLLSFVLLMNVLNIQAQREVVYFLHGQGADERLFKNIHLDTTRLECRFIRLPLPEKKEYSMHHYAETVAKMIDTTRTFSLVGVSLGGMVTTELTTLLHPRKSIIIASAGSNQELPQRYKIMRNVPFYRLIPAFCYKIGSFIVQPLVEPDRRKEATTCNAMLRDKNPAFLKRATDLIIQWERSEKPSNLVHIHGTNDHTLPFRNIKPNYILLNGSHMMTLTRGLEISVLLNKELK
jgi:pimeloyl-ACP methyl ester carboxylesterase